MKYCSNCGSDQLFKEIPEGDNRERYCCHNCGMIHYSNPKMVVGCLPIYEDKILLCRRAIEPRSGYWNLPAGYLENGETLQGGALRETWEEALAKVKIVRMHCIYNIPRINQIYFFFLATMDGPDYGVGMESEEVCLFDPVDIPFEDMAFPSSTFAIRKYLAFKESDFHGVHIGEWHHE